jgi:hypothetical protein
MGSGDGDGVAVAVRAGSPDSRPEGVADRCADVAGVADAAGDPVAATDEELDGNRPVEVSRRLTAISTRAPTTTIAAAAAAAPSHAPPDRLDISPPWFRP